MFLIGDAASCAKTGQKIPEDFYNLQLMVDKVARAGAEVGVCGVPAWMLAESLKRSLSKAHIAEYPCGT